MSAKINLLPWRLERRKAREREFYLMLGAAAVAGILLVLAAVGVHASWIDSQEQRNRYLRTEIGKLDEQIKEIERLEERRRQLVARKDVIERLQGTRTQMVHLFDQLVRTIPEGVRLTAIKQAGQQLTLEGFAQSQQRVSSYMRQLEQSEWLTGTALRIVEAKDEDQRSRFSFTLGVRLIQPGAEAAEAGDDLAFPDEAGARS